MDNGNFEGYKSKELDLKVIKVKSYKNKMLDFHPF